MGGFIQRDARHVGQVRCGANELHVAHIDSDEGRTVGHQHKQQAKTRVQTNVTRVTRQRYASQLQTRRRIEHHHRRGLCPHCNIQSTSGWVRGQTDRRSRDGVRTLERGLAVDHCPDQTRAVGDEDLIGGVERVQGRRPGRNERGHRADCCTSWSWSWSWSWDWSWDWSGSWLWSRSWCWRRRRSWRSQRDWLWRWRWDWCGFQWCREGGATNHNGRDRC